MDEPGTVPIKRLTSGVQKFDGILGGGWPEDSFNLILGDIGSGKTTLVNQLMFANVSRNSMVRQVRSG